MCFRFRILPTRVCNIKTNTYCVYEETGMWVVLHKMRIQRTAPGLAAESTVFRAGFSAPIECLLRLFRYSVASGKWAPAEVIFACKRVFVRFYLNSLINNSWYYQGGLLIKVTSKYIILYDTQIRYARTCIVRLHSCLPRKGYGFPVGEVYYTLPMHIIRLIHQSQLSMMNVR